MTGSAQPRVYDRDGKLLGECVRGDMYIRDMKNTKGHITSCTGGCWHPTDRYTAITSSEDGTVRWDTGLFALGRGLECFQPLLRHRLFALFGACTPGQQQRDSNKARAD